MSLYHCFEGVSYTILNHDLVVKLSVVEIGVEVKLLLGCTSFFMFVEGIGVQDSGIPRNVGRHDDLRQFLKISASRLGKYHMTKSVFHSQGNMFPTRSDDTLVTSDSTRDVIHDRTEMSKLRT
jgi:hypothetical protein